MGVIVICDHCGRQMNTFAEATASLNISKEGTRPERGIFGDMQWESEALNFHLCRKCALEIKSGMKHRPAFKAGGIER